MPDPLYRLMEEIADYLKAVDIDPSQWHRMTIVHRKVDNGNLCDYLEIADHNGNAIKAFGNPPPDIGSPF